MTLHHTRGEDSENRQNGDRDHCNHLGFPSVRDDAARGAARANVFGRGLSATRTCDVPAPWGTPSVVTFDNSAPDFVLMESRVLDQATRHGFELVDAECSRGGKWWRWRNQGGVAGWFRTRREAAYWMHQWLARYGYTTDPDS